MRYRVLPTDKTARKAWELRSSMLLDDYLDAHDATLADLELERPLHRDQVAPFLVEWKRRLMDQGIKVSIVGLVPVPYGTGGTVPMPAVEPFVSLVDRAGWIARHLNCEPGPVVSFLLTGKAFSLPWIEISHQITKLGPTFTIHVGTADVTAEDVRRAYVAAVRDVLGSEKARALPAHIVPLVLEEAEGRRQGRTWKQRHENWKRYADQWGIETKYETLRSYMNYIKKKRGQYEWIALELEQADREWAALKTERGGKG